MRRKVIPPQCPEFCRIAVVLYAPFGCGHFKAAQAIATSARALDPRCRVETVDASRFLPWPIGALFIKLWQLLSCLLPAPYDYVYHRFGSRFRDSIFAKKIVDIAAKRAVGASCMQCADVVISTHWFGAAIAARIKSRFKFHLSVVTTDYVIHSLHVYPEVDMYFSSTLGEMLLSDEDLQRVRQRVNYFGIPIDRRFAEDHFASRDVNLDSLNVIVSFGGLGLQWRESLPMLGRVSSAVDGVQFTVLAGSNASLARYAKAYLPRGTTVLNDHDDVVLAYRCADAFVGKAGGLSVTEALASRLPVAIIAALPGQEVVNRRALVSARVATALSTVDELACWLRDIQRYKRLACSSDVVPRDSSVRIADTILKSASTDRNTSLAVGNGLHESFRRAA